MTNTPNDMPKGTLSLDQIRDSARDVLALHPRFDDRTPTEDIDYAVREYCDNPDWTRPDYLRVRTRILQMLRTL